MRIERGGGGIAMIIPVTGPAGWVNPGAAPVSVSGEVCLIAPGAVPGPADWHAGTWDPADPDVPLSLTRYLRWLVSTPGLVAGDYLAKVRLTAGVEQVVLTSGRVTVD